MLMSGPAHGAAKEGHTVKAGAAMGQACYKPPPPGHEDRGLPECQEQHPAPPDHAPEHSVLQIHTMVWSGQKGTLSQAARHNPST